jgi:phosphoribosylaminoimidazole-succinocarboxamide synthase
MAKRLGREEGEVLIRPTVEFSLKSDPLDDPWINEYYAVSLGLATEEQVKEVIRQAFAVNDVLKPFLADKGVVLVDFKLEFGLFHGQVMLGDEISPDTCRFWDADTHEHLDKDRFRRDLGDVDGGYKEMLKRLTGEVL